MTGDDLAECDDLIAGAQIAGARDQQEDCFRSVPFWEPDPDGCDLLMVVADGMGGHRGGAEASQLAVGAFVETFTRARGGVVRRLRAALDGANGAVGSYAAANAGYRRMGCTLVACVITEGATAHWVSVGDSPLWHVGAGGDRLERLNADHSMRPVLEKMVRHGHMTVAEAEGESAQVLRSALTGGALTLVDEGAPPIQLQVGDRILLASDGLETLPDSVVLSLSRERGSAASIVSDLLAAVEARAVPSQDNATVVVYRHVTAGAFRFSGIRAHQGSGGAGTRGGLSGIRDE